MYNKKILSNINNFEVRFHTLLNQQKKNAPKTSQNLEKTYLNAQFSIKNFFIFIFILFSFLLKKKPAKYIFQNTSYNEIIGLFNPKEVLILANKNEINYCKKNNYDYHWIGHLHHAAIYFLSNRSNFLLIKSINIIKKIINFNDRKYKYLFLHSTNELSGMILSEVFKDNKYIKTICISHSYLHKAKKHIKLITDINSNYNFVWAEDQINLIQDNKFHTYNLGLPYEIKIPDIVSNKIILVGHGIEQLDKTFFHFKKVYSMIDKSLFSVEFRPHPNHKEELDYCNKYFPSIKINKENKMDLLRKSKKIYIGFTSSLLYEASEHENYVIILDNSFLHAYLDFKYDKYLEEKEYPQLNKYLNTVRFKIKKNNRSNVNLNERFMHCFNKINNN